MLEHFIHSPMFCCMLGGLTVPLAQWIENSNASKKISIKFRLMRFVGAVMMYSTIGAITGYVFFGQYDPGRKVRYFTTGLIAPFIINRMFATARDLLSKVRVTISS